MTQFRFSYHPGLCTGCKSCQMACHDRYDLPCGFYFRKVDTLYRKNSPDLLHSWSFSSDACHHCSHPICVQVCPSGAMTKESHGLVLIHREHCIGCGRCVRHCPHQAVFLHPTLNRAMKCDGCQELLHQQRMPVCVTACPTGALELLEKPDDTPKEEKNV